MKVVSILSQKGGAGKTTLAIHLAVASELAKKSAVIIDLDPQSSSTEWGDHRDKEFPSVVSAQMTRLPQLLDTSRSMGVKLCIIDTSPNSESSSLAAARSSDFILIPCRPSILDIRAIRNTVDIAKLAKKKATVVLNCVPARGSLADEAEEAISSYDIGVCPIRIFQRADYQHSLTTGKAAQEYDSKGKAAQEIKELYTWICKHV